MATRKHPGFSDELVMTKILYIRNQKVILDKDLAIMYGVNPRRLREQVNRNKEDSRSISCFNYLKMSSTGVAKCDTFPAIPVDICLMPLQNTAY